MTEIERQLNVVKEYIRSVVDGGGPRAFRRLPAAGLELEAVHLGTCAAEFKKYAIKFRCLDSGVSDKPKDLIWPLRLDIHSGHLVCSVRGIDLHSEEIGQAILEQLNKNCTDRKREIESFYD